MLYQAEDKQRIQEIEPDPSFPKEEYRSPWRRDCARLIHCSSFRRLQGKTQLFPGRESDFFRNRLTHSLEVAQIAKSIAIKLNHDLISSGSEYKIETDIVEFASLAHDLGHPPFGHFGEKVLDEKMSDCGGFEGNAQTLRLLTKIEKRQQIENTIFGIDSDGADKRVGLNLTARSIASVLKYDREIPFDKEQTAGEERVIKGYYKSEQGVVNLVKKKICNNKEYPALFKTIECQIMDIADDIAYSTYDLDDSFKAGFIKPIDLLCASEKVLEKVAEKVNAKISGADIDMKEAHDRINEMIFFDQFELPKELKKLLSKDEQHWVSIQYANNLSNEIARNAYFRTRFTSKLVGDAIRKVVIKKINQSIPALSEVELEYDKSINVEILKNFIYESQILSPRVQMVSFRSKEIIDTIYKILLEKEGYRLLPDDFRTIVKKLKAPEDKKRTVCDFIAGMTDRYALEFYGRLTSENPQTIFKPF